MKLSSGLTFHRFKKTWTYKVKDIDEAVGNVSINKEEDNKGYIAIVSYEGEDLIKEGRRISVDGYSEDWAREAWDERIRREQQANAKKFVKNITNEDLAQIKEQLEAGEKFGIIVRRLGVPPGQLGNLIDRIIREIGSSEKLLEIQKQVKDFDETW